MLSATQVILGFFLPATLIGVALLACRLFPTGFLGTVFRASFSPIVAIGFSLAFLQFEPRMNHPIGSNVVDWLFYTSLLLGLLGLLDGLLHPPLWLRAIAIVLLWHIAARLILLPQIPSYITESAADIWIDAATFIALIWFLAFESLADRVTGFAVPASLAILSVGAAVLLAMTFHIQTNGQLAGALMAICLGAIAATSFARRIFFRGFAGIIALLLQLLLLHGYFYTNDTLTTAQQAWALLFLASPALLFIADFPATHRVRSGWRLIIRVAPLALMIALLIGLAIRDYLKPDAPQTSQQEF